MSNKEKLKKQIIDKIRALQLGLQEPLFSEYSKFEDLRKITIEILVNLVRLEEEEIRESFNNKKSKENGK